jgi:hypothetical protein
MLGNPHIFLVKTGSRNRFSKKEEFLLSNMKRVCPKCGRVFSQEDGFCDDCGCRLILASEDMKIPGQPEQNFYEQPPVQSQPSQNFYEQPPVQSQPSQNFYEQPPVQPEQNFYEQPPIQPQPEKKPQEKSNLLLLIIIVLCVLIIAAGILIGFLIFRDSEGEGDAGNGNAEGALQTTAVLEADAPSAAGDDAETIVTTLATEENGLHFAENTMTTTVTTTTEAPEKRYQVFTEACSWEDARKKCEAAGGHLAYITSEEDWAKVINALNGTGLKYVWLGGTTSISADETRITATWLDGSSMDYIYDANHWFANEPSGRDFSSADKSLEPYILLWNVNDVWSLNDSSDAVLSCYKHEQIGYVCEFD